MGSPDPEFWDAVRAHLRQHYASMCRHWFDDIEALDLSHGVLRLLVREPIQLRYLQKSCQDQFTEALQAVSGRLIVVQFVGEHELGRAAPHHHDGGRTRSGASTSARPGGTNGTGFNPDGAHPAESRPAGSGPADTNGHATRPATPSAGLREGLLISPDHSFDQFVVGPGNRLAHAAAVAVSDKPGQSYNPFFIHGGVGLGKTHLLQAICQTVLRRNPDFQLHYVSCESFMTEFLEAVQAGEMSNFRHQYRNVDMLVIDDIHDLAKRDRTQEEFFHTFNTLHQAGKQIVLSSDAPPNEIPDLEERLTSRFNSGLVARIDKPSYETRVAIVKQKARLRGLPMPDDVANYIASRIDTNIRELEGAITRIQGLAMVNEAPIALDIAKEAIGDTSADTDARHLTIQDILELISDYYGIKVSELLSKRRHKSVALPRQVGMWIARQHTRFSLEEIGGYFGGRDHTTVMHAVRTVDARRRDDATLNQDILRLETTLLHAST
ncbi:MAG: chromosomal replication initiator protein DnaA [Phycisphaerales bacterium]|nr:chromosomal replication initiator protein DnaA [Phycisphaerales bacterium]